MNDYDQRARNELKALMVARGLSWKGDTRSDEEMIAALVENDKAADTPTPEEEPGWYISDVHALKALGYLTVKLVEDGQLRPAFIVPTMLDRWSEALSATMDPQHPSPIGPDPERFLR